MSNSKLKLLSTFFSDNQIRAIILKVMFAIKYCFKPLANHNSYLNFCICYLWSYDNDFQQYLKHLVLFIDLQIEGYVQALSTVRTAFISRTPYFDCLIQTNQDKKVR